MTNLRPAITLRQRAEAAWQEKATHAPPQIEALSSQETLRLLHELQVHQIQLELQNEELRSAQVELDQSRARYFDLYDLAPMGYCTLSEKGLILQANLTAATLFGVTRGALCQQPFGRFILEPDQAIYYRQRKQLLESGKPQTFELRMLRRDGTPFWAHLAATLLKDDGAAPELRVMLSDISERHRLEQQVQQLAFHDSLTALPNRRLLADRLRQTMELSARSGCCSVSIGVALFLGREAPQNDVMSWADEAMYQAKAAGRNVIRFHEPVGQARPRQTRPHDSGQYRFHSSKNTAKGGFH